MAARFPAEQEVNLEEVFTHLVTTHSTKSQISRIQPIFPLDLTHEDIVRWFRTHPERFVVFEDDGGTPHYVAARVQHLSLCHDYRARRCTRLECTSYHLCREFIAGQCSQGVECPLSHSFQEPHNKKLLVAAGVARFTDEQVKRLFQISVLQVCGEYNTGHGLCKYGDKCIRIHVCKKHAMATCTQGRACALKHDFESAHSRRLLRAYGLQGRAEEEVLRELLVGRPRTRGRTEALDRARILERERLRRQGAAETILGRMLEDERTHRVVKETKVKELTKVENVVAPQVEEKAGGKDTEAKPAKSELLQALEAAEKAPHKFHPATVNIHETDDVTTICVANMAHQCSEGTTCKLHHWLDTKFLWQVKLLGAWESFEQGMGRKIEEAFCDPATSEMDAKLPAAVLGVDTCEIHLNFETMTGKARLFGQDDIYSLRRLCTPSSRSTPPGDPTTHGHRSQYMWYWHSGLADTDWLPFEEADQDVLEQAFVKSESVVTFGSRFRVNLKDMEQTNITTKRSKKIRRRPLFEDL